MEDNEPIDDLSIYKATRCIGNDLYNTEDGLAEREETIRRRLLELPEEERETNTEARDKIFKDVIGEDGHGWIGTDILFAPNTGCKSLLVLSRKGKAVADFLIDFLVEDPEWEEHDPDLIEEITEDPPTKAFDERAEWVTWKG
ncbi:hypothetical protein GIB67_024174 [Kingdonia uniflora]|uniref:Uncharacterized protein n=1 Tax=Kingdonia uniflora TaxID=39325 RepID=A0A7J7LZG0_9MAGN|nr:hypothetical protein GIB67_024174 [Kingdonia uniflora]